MDLDDKTGWEDLANAIIVQAAEDYRSTCRSLKKHPHFRKLHAAKRSLERFFRSAWFRTLSGADGSKLIQDILKEVAQ